MKQLLLTIAVISSGVAMAQVKNASRLLGKWEYYESGNVFEGTTRTASYNGYFPEVEGPNLSSIEISKTNKEQLEIRIGTAPFTLDSERFMDRVILEIENFPLNAQYNKKIDRARRFGLEQSKDIGLITATTHANGAQLFHPKKTYPHREREILANTFDSSEIRMEIIFGNDPTIYQYNVYMKQGSAGLFTDEVSIVDKMIKHDVCTVRLNRKKKFLIKRIGVVGKPFDKYDRQYWFTGEKISNKSWSFYNNPIFIYEMSLKGSGLALRKVLGTYIEPESNFAYSSHAKLIGINSINTYDYKAFIEAFVKDAKVNHGLTLNPGNMIVDTQRFDDGTIAVSYGLNTPGVFLRIDPNDWAKASRIKKWYIIYHELGHDILNLKHGGTPMMDPTSSNRKFTYAEFYSMKVKMFNYYKTSSNKTEYIK